MDSSITSADRKEDVMKIDNGAAQQAYANAAYRGAVGSTRGATPAAGPSAPATAVQPQSSDSVQISSQGRVRAQALDAVRATPPTRSDLVAQLRAQVQAGTFTVDDHSLARHLADHLSR